MNDFCLIPYTWSSLKQFHFKSFEQEKKGAKHPWQWNSFMLLFESIENIQLSSTKKSLKNYAIINAEINYFLYAYGIRFLYFGKVQIIFSVSSSASFINLVIHFVSNGKVRLISILVTPLL